MARISRQTREIINIVIFFLALGLALTFYVIYPLTRTSRMMGRPTETIVKADSLPPNNPEAFVTAGLTEVDTFRVEADGLTTVAAILIPGHDDSLSAPTGMTILLPSQYQTRDSLIALANSLVNSGLTVVAYDQRATGLSTGKYHGAGRYEAGDLQEVIAWLDIRGKLVHPVTVVGFGIGADAALMADQQEKRIDQIVAVDPYLTTRRMLDILKTRHNALWFPFYRTVMWWWYGIRSGYVTESRTIEDLKPPIARTLIIVPSNELAAPEMTRLKDISSGAQLTVQTQPDSTSALYDQVETFITQNQ